MLTLLFATLVCIYDTSLNYLCSILIICSFTFIRHIDSVMITWLLSPSAVTRAVTDTHWHAPMFSCLCAKWHSCKQVIAINTKILNCILKYEKRETEVKLSLCLIKHHSMKAYGRVDVWLHAFLTPTWGGGEWSASLPDLFASWGGKKVRILIGGWVGPVAQCGVFGNEFLDLAKNWSLMHGFGM
jgi:hypothetical protein